MRPLKSLVDFLDPTVPMSRNGMLDRALDRVLGTPQSNVPKTPELPAEVILRLLTERCRAEEVLGDNQG
jgi:hypothetical protein